MPDLAEPSPGAARRGGRTPLSRGSIVAAAVELASEEGPAALTLRRLAGRLDVDPTAFYRHFPDKDSLVLAVGDHVTRWVLDTAHEQLAQSVTWQETVRALAHAWWKACRTFPGVVALTASRTTGEAAEREVVELLLETLEPLGMSSRDTVLAYRMIGDSVLGLAGNHAAVLSMDSALQDKDATAWSRIYSAQRREDLPSVHRHVSELVGASMDDIFEFTVDTLILGIQARLAATPDP